MPTLLSSLIFSFAAQAQYPSPRKRSSENRIDKDITINYMALGIGPSRSGSIGGNFGVFLTSDSQIDLEIVNGKELLENWFSWSSSYDIKTSSAGIHYKQFLGNTFYMRFGGDYRKVDYHYTNKDIFTGDLLTENRFKGTSVAATVLIGNQWQWENFTMGCDWFGFAFPISHSVESESATGSVPNVQNLEDNKDYLLKNPTALAVRFYIGASF